MLKNNFINRQATLKIARALGELNSCVVFVGGAMVSMYADDPAAEDVRPTKDIDLTFQITSAGKLEQLREELISKGFRQTHEDDVICRFRFDDLLVDLMSTQSVGWAPSNRWFKPGFEQAIAVELDDVNINIMPLPYFLASKIDAFFDRGLHDVYASADLEDIVYLFNYSTTLVKQIRAAEPEVFAYLQQATEKILTDERILSAIRGHLYYETADERMVIIKEKMNSVVNSTTD